MLTGWRYRFTSVLGVCFASVLAVYTANLPVLQSLLTTYVPVVWRLEPIVLSGTSLQWALFISTVLVVGAFWPLFQPEPRRVLDVVFSVEKRVGVAVSAMATLGYFQWSHRLPRQTVIMTALLLAVTLPLLFVIISRVPAVDGQRSIVVGDDPAGIEDIAEVYEKPVLGYVAPPSQYQSPDNPPETAQTELTDGGNPTFQQGYVGGLSRFEEAAREYAIDAAILAFDRADRGEFFGTLHTCYDNGIEAKAHVDHIDSLLVSSTSSGGPIVDIDLEPWDAQDRLLKRLFDIMFAGTALLVLSPLILIIAAAILLEGNGPILFSQNRTYRFGDTFTVYKFRTLKPEPDGEVGTTFDKSRETPLGNFLRMTHLDEIPQLWSILTGDMSVVGPRPAQTDLEGEFENAAATWKRRWFVKPGLTGLAQIRDATSEEPALKIDYDIEYIRCQSFSFDLKIVIRQLWQVVRDVASIRTDRS